MFRAVFIFLMLPSSLFALSSYEFRARYYAFEPRVFPTKLNEIQHVLGDEGKHRAYLVTNSTGEQIAVEGLANLTSNTEFILKTPSKKGEVTRRQFTVFQIVAYTHQVVDEVGKYNHPQVSEFVGRYQKFEIVGAVSRNAFMQEGYRDAYAFLIRQNGQLRSIEAIAVARAGGFTLKEGDLTAPIEVPYSEVVLMTTFPLPGFGIFNQGPIPPIPPDEPEPPFKGSFDATSRHWRWFWSTHGGSNLLTNCAYSIVSSFARAFRR